MKNSQKYTIEEVTRQFTREELAEAVAYTTNWEWAKKDILRGIDRENGKPEKCSIGTKGRMVEWIMEWLDDETIKEEDREDIIEFIKNVNQED